MLDFLWFSDKAHLVIYTAYALIGVGTFIVARTLLQEQESRAAQENLDLKDRKASDFLVKLTRPFFTQYVVPMVRGKPFWDSKRREFKRKLVAGGMKDELTPDEFIAYKAFLIFFFPFVGGVLNSFDLIDVSWYFVLASGIIGWFYPNFWIKQRIKKRQDQILKAMPFIVDLLALSTEAGLDFIGAIGKVVEKAVPSPLVEEFAQLLKEIKVGSSRQEALREMAARIDMTEMSSFVAILISADQMGASIGKVLRQQSDSIRAARLIRAEKAGAAAQPKLVVATGVIVFPAVLLMIIAPFAISFLGSGAVQ